MDVGTDEEDASTLQGSCSGVPALQVPREDLNSNPPSARKPVDEQNDQQDQLSKTLSVHRRGRASVVSSSSSQWYLVIMKQEQSD
jgi:hypothetical protein